MSENDSPTDGSGGEQRDFEQFETDGTYEEGRYIAFDTEDGDTIIYDTKYETGWIQVDEDTAVKIENME